MSVLGIISGTGELPKVIALEAKSKGYRVVAITLEPLVDNSIGKYVDEVRAINVGRLGEIIETLKKTGVKEVVMAGKVPKLLLYKSKITPDWRAIKLLLTLKDRSDDSILLAIAKELESEGLQLLNTTDFCSSLITPEGILTEERPSDDEWKDIRFGVKMAKEIGRLDIGQTVVVKNQAVMAVEAIEGTDEAIKRGGFYAGEGAVVVKVSKPNQDMRFDVPVAGLNTLKSMVDVKARVLALESGKTILLRKEQLLREANEAGITIVGVKE